MIKLRLDKFATWSLISVAALSCVSRTVKEVDETSVLESRRSTLDVAHQPLGSPQGHRRTKYPIILQHGFLAGQNAGFFVNVREHLSAMGYTVFETEVSAANSIEIRAKQLAHQVDIVLERTHAAKVNIIGHSMGGLDARYLISSLHYADRVASLSTLSTPHRGTPYADYVLNDESLRVQNRQIAFMNVLGAMVNNTTSINDADARTAIENLTEKYITTSFNQANPDSAQVYYQSWGASSGPNSEDRMKVTMRKSWEICFEKRGPNDGLIPVSSAKWGEYKGTLTADHLDLIGIHFLDRGSPFQHIPFFEELALGLNQKGF